MRWLAIIVRYLVWHYSLAVLQFSRVYKNITVFLYNFFSIPILLKTFFAPWRRMGESYPEDKTQLVEIISSFVVNMIVRMVGVVMRSVIILIGFLTVTIFIIFYPILLLLWLALPVIVVVLLTIGVALLFK